jgi:hypothetical protein
MNNVMFERFAEEARRATALASQEARAMGHDFIGTEHMLLGLLSVSEGPAYTVLRDLEVTADQVRALVSQRVQPAQGGDVESPPFTASAKKALSWALREALDMKAPLIGSQHVLLGLVDVPDGGGAQILEELAGSLLFVRQAVLSREPGTATGDAEAVGAGAAGGQEASLEATTAGAAAREGAEGVVTPATGPLGGRYLRRWAAQTRTMLRPPGGPARSPVRMARPLGPAPRCPSCQASLETEARYLRLAVAAGPEGHGEAEGEGESEVEGAGWGGDAEASGTHLGGEAASEGQGGVGEGQEGEGEEAAAEAEGEGAAAEGEEAAAEAGTADDAGSLIMVTVVYCRRCGVALGTV